MQKAKMRDLLDRLQSTNIAWSDLAQTTGGDMSIEALELVINKKRGVKANGKMRQGGNTM